MAQLRQGPSGRPIVGNEAGDVLTWNGTEWEAEPVPGWPLEYGSQATWFVDPANSTGLASDDNVGDTELAPLLTMREFARRVSLPTILVVEPVATIMSDVPDPAADPFIFQIESVAPYVSGDTIRIQGTPIVLETLTLTGAVNQNPATNAYNTISVAGFDFTPYLGKRIRCISGSGTVDSIAWIDSLGGAVDTAVINRAYRLTTGLPVSLAVGNIIVIEDLTEVGPIAGRSTNANVAFGAYFKDIQLPELQQFDEFTIISNVQFVACKLPMVGMSCSPGACAFTACRLEEIVGLTCIMLGRWLVHGCSMKNCVLQYSAVVHLNQDNLHSGRFTAKSGSNVIGGNNVGFKDWPAGGNNAAFALEPYAQCDSVQGRFWGVCAVANTIGMKAHAGAHFFYSTKPTVVGATAGVTDWNVAGTTGNWAAAPASSVIAAFQAGITTRG